MKSTENEPRQSPEKGKKEKHKDQTRKEKTKEADSNLDKNKNTRKTEFYKIFISTKQGKSSTYLIQYPILKLQSNLLYPFFFSATTCELSLQRNQKT